MVSKDEVLRLVQAKGPMIPNDIRREVGGDTLTVGAVLSELSRDGKIKISHVKVGGSPVYYAPGQAARLQDYVTHLNDKQQKAFRLLKERKVLRDREQEPVIRVALRDIKDFAKGFEINANGSKEIYWKWYLTPNEEAEQFIRKELKIPGGEKEREQPKQTAPRKERGKEFQKSLEEDTGKEAFLPDDEFGRQVLEFFSKNKIEVVEHNVIRKGSEIDFVLSVPSALGKQEYYCKAKSKKKSNDGDLSSAYIQGQVKKLPVIYLTAGDVTKKAEEMLGKEFKGMILKKI